MAKRFSLKTITLAVILASLLSSATYMYSALGQDQTTVRILPTPVNVGPNVPTDPFVVNAVVQNISFLKGWQVNITFDPTILEALDISLPDDHVFAGQNVFEVAKDINNSAGFVVWAVAQGLNGSVQYDPINVTEGKLCQIEFRGIAEGWSNVTFASEGTIVTKLSTLPDPLGSTVEVFPTAVRGEIEIYPELPMMLLVPVLIIVSFAVLFARRRYLALK
ncbi:MAG: hypothetical protein JSV51_06910 [Candidatus Bathyarchaeota archaeon]|nr:MAG: hypothetical protein JSV51_06910 [Candidatus Bathyarchaeota archaeon]